MGPSRHGLAPGPTPRTRRPIGADGLGLTAVDRAVAAGAHSGPRGARKTKSLRARAPSDPSNVGSIASSAAARWPDPFRARAAELRGCRRRRLRRRRRPGGARRDNHQPRRTRVRARARSAPALPVLAPTPRRAPSRPHGARRSRSDRAIGDPRGAACTACSPRHGPGGHRACAPAQAGAGRAGTAGRRRWRGACPPRALELGGRGV